MKKSLTLGVVFISSLILAACGNGNTKKDSSSNKTVTVAKPKEDKYYFKNDELRIHDLKIKITNYKVIPVGEKGNEYGKKPVLAIWYKTTNLTNKEIDPDTAWMATFEAYQDNNKNRENKLDVGSLPDQKFLDTQQENIKKNGTVENAVSYELDDDTTPVTLKATKGFEGRELGTKTFKIKDALEGQSDSSAYSDSSSTTVQDTAVKKNTSHSEPITHLANAQNPQKQNSSQQISSKQPQQVAASSSSQQTLTQFVNEHGMSPVAYKMQHNGMSEKEALDSTPRGMKSSGEIQRQNELNNQH